MTLLQALYSVRLERMLMEQINYNLLFRWIVWLSIDVTVWHPTGFTHNRDQLLRVDVARAFLQGLLALPRVKRLLSSEQFSVDGTSIDAWASMKSFAPKDKGDKHPAPPTRNAERNFRGEIRSNETSASTTDPDARFYRKSGCQSARGITLVVDKAYDVADFVGELRARWMSPTTARFIKTGTRRKSAIDGRTTRHPGYELSLRCRKRIEEIFGWTKASAGLTKSKLKVLAKPNPSSAFSPQPITSSGYQNG